MYLRVIPRDLFNEAKLLKCLGQLSLTIHEGTKFPLCLDHDTSEDEGFRIDQDESTGALFCANLGLSCRGRPIALVCPYNSKDAYPLRFVFDDENEGRVFDDYGVFSVEFVDLLEGRL